MTDQPTAGAALKPCAHCGSEPEVRFAMDEHWVHCTRCKASAGLKRGRQEAIAAWNTRTPASGPVEADDRLAVAVEAVLDLAAKAVEDHQREGREWVPGSLWDDITRQAAGRIRAIKPQALALLTSGEQPVTDPYKLDGGEAGE